MRFQMHFLLESATAYRAVKLRSFATFFQMVVQTTFHLVTFPTISRTYMNQFGCFTRRKCRRPVGSWLTYCEKRSILATNPTAQRVKPCRGQSPMLIGFFFLHTFQPFVSTIPWYHYVPKGEKERAKWNSGGSLG